MVVVRSSQKNGENLEFVMHDRVAAVVSIALMLAMLADSAGSQALPKNKKCCVAAKENPPPGCVHPCDDYGGGLVCDANGYGEWVPGYCCQTDKTNYNCSATPNTTKHKNWYECEDDCGTFSEGCKWDKTLTEETQSITTCSGSPCRPDDCG